MRRPIALMALAVALSLGSGGWTPCLAVDETLPGYVTAESDDQLFVEVVDAHHLVAGDTGVIQFQGRDAAVVRVSKVNGRHLDLQVISRTPDIHLAASDNIVFQSQLPTDLETAKKARELDKTVLGGQLDKEGSVPATSSLNQLLFADEFNPNGAELSAGGPAVAGGSAAALDNSTSIPAPAEGSTLKTGSSDKDFVPLLAPVAVSAQTKTTSVQDANLFHGRLRLREIYQSVPSQSSYGAQSRMDTNGSVDRLWASPWSLLWNGNVTYRGGNSFSGAPDYHVAKLHVYSALLSRKMDDGGALEAGRFVPLAMPGLGFLDGAHLEHAISPSWRAGALAAFRPDRVTLGMTSKEPLAGAYGSTEQGSRGRLFYSGTLAMFQSFYRSVRDELAVLYDHRVDLGPRVNWFATSQVDFDSGSMQIHKGPQLTRLDSNLTAQAMDFLSVRTGTSHYERPDTAAERDLGGGNLTNFLNSTWRYFVGSTQRLPWNLTTDEELSLLRTEGQADDSLWRVSISRTGLFFLPGGLVTLAAYKVPEAQGKGEGFQASLSAPFLDNRLFLTLASNAQYVSPYNQPAAGKTFDVNDFTSRLTWQITRAWNLDLGFTQTYQSHITSTVTDAGLSYRW